MAEPTFDDIDALVGPATPHFAYQLRARVRELIDELPADHPVRRYGEQKMELLDRLGHASSLAEDGPREPQTRIGWETIPSSAPAYDPLPRSASSGTSS
jgi:RecB family exonuclease